MADAATIAVDAVEADYRGHEAFWAVAADTTTSVPTPELIYTQTRTIQRGR